MFRDSAGLLEAEEKGNGQNAATVTNRPTDRAKEEAKKAAGGMTKGIKVLPHSTL